MGVGVGGWVGGGDQNETSGTHVFSKILTCVALRVLHFSAFVL